MKPNNIEAMIGKIIKDAKVRAGVARKSHYWFFNIYFTHYVKHETAPFQKEIFSLSEDEKVKLLVVSAFRGSGKSTIITMSLPLWSILGEHQKKYILILSQTQLKARVHLMNIKRELESNDLLRRDLGPFQEESDQWAAHALVIPRFGAKIATGSLEQSIRGFRHGAHRPDLIIIDDIEDTESVRTREGRDKTFRWLTREVIPSGDVNTRIVLVGNLIHEDSVVSRLKQKINAGELEDGAYRGIPIIGEGGTSAWPGKYPTLAAVDAERRKIMDDVAWDREFMLKHTSERDQVVQRGWIQYYDTLPSTEYGNGFRKVMIGVDLAISEKSTADYTAMVTASVYGYDKNFRIYIHPNPVNRRMNFPETLFEAKLLANVSPRPRDTKILVEDVGMQAALFELLKLDGYNAEGVKVGSQDKRSRLALTSPAIREGIVRFPREGAEELIEQLVGFGQETHDDLCDAFTLIVNNALSSCRTGVISGIGRADAI